MASNLNRGYPVPPQSGPPSNATPTTGPQAVGPTPPGHIKQEGPATMQPMGPGMRPPERPMGLQHAGPPPNRQYGTPTPVYQVKLLLYYSHLFSIDTWASWVLFMFCVNVTTTLHKDLSIFGITVSKFSRWTTYLSRGC